MSDSPLSQRLRELCSRRGMSWRSASRQAGLNETYVRDIIRGAVQRPSFLALDRLSRVLNVPVTAFYVEAQGGGGGDTQTALASHLPIVGEARGGAEAIPMDPDRPLGQVMRPPWLANVVCAYAVVMRGSSMEPRYYDGELLFVHPLSPVRSGDFVLIRLADGANYVKRLVARDDSWVKVAQLRPEAAVDYRSDQVAQLHRIAGSTDQY